MRAISLLCVPALVAVLAQAAPVPGVNSARAFEFPDLPRRDIAPSGPPSKGQGPPASPEGAPAGPVPDGPPPHKGQGPPVSLVTKKSELLPELAKRLIPPPTPKDTNPPPTGPVPPGPPPKTIVLPVGPPTGPPPGPPPKNLVPPVTPVGPPTGPPPGPPPHNLVPPVTPVPPVTN